MNKKIWKLPFLLLVIFLFMPLPQGKGILYGQGEVLVNIHFIDTCIRDILRLLQRQHNLNMVIGNEVEGEMSIHLEGVRLETALRSIVASLGFGYRKRENIIYVAEPARLHEMIKELEEEIVPVVSRIFHLRYANANDMKKVIERHLSKEGKVEVYGRTLQRGWGIGGIEEAELGVGLRLPNIEEEAPKILVVTDFSHVVSHIEKMIEKLDRPTQQVLIEAIIVEVDEKALRDVGIEWRTLGEEGAVGEKAITLGGGREITIQMRPGEVPPTPVLGFEGLQLLYQQLTQVEFEIILRALEEEGIAHILSNPTTLVLEGHEAHILVGEKYPIFKTEIHPETGLLYESFYRYEPIGFALRVIPQIVDNNHVHIAYLSFCNRSWGSCSGCYWFSDETNSCQRN